MWATVKSDGAQRKLRSSFTNGIPGPDLAERTFQDSQTWTGSNKEDGGPIGIYGSIDHANFLRADGTTVGDAVCQRAAVCDGTKAIGVFSLDVHEVRIQRKDGFRRGVVRDHSNACTQGFRGFVSGHSMSALDEKSE